MNYRNQKNNTLVLREFAINCGLPVLHSKTFLLSIVNGIFLLPVQQMLSNPHNNANLVALRSPLIRLAECSHLQYFPLQIHIPIRRTTRPLNALQKFLGNLKRALFPVVSNANDRVGSRIPRNNIWSSNLQFNAHCQHGRKKPLNLHNCYSGLQLHIGTIISTKLNYIKMSFKFVATNRGIANGYKVTDNVSSESRNAMLHSQRWSPQIQSLFTHLVYSLAQPFSESCNNTTMITMATNSSLNASDATQALKDNCCESNVCAHPIQLAVWHGRKRTTSEVSDNICFFDSEVDDDESTNANDSYDKDTESKEEWGTGSEDTDDDEKQQLNSSDYTAKTSTTKKKVRFNLKPEVHTMYTWNYAYRSARKGNWESYALDRSRFQLRIQRAALYLDPILNAEYRKFIYSSRFIDA